MKHSFTLFKENKKDKKSFPVAFRVFDNGYSYEWLGFEVEECHWDKSEGWLYRSSKDKDKLKIEQEKGLVQHPNFSKLNDKIKNYHNRVEKIIDKYEAEGRKHELTGKRLITELSGGSSEIFIKFAREFINENYSDWLTIKSKNKNINIIERYIKKKPLLITQINYQWICEFEKWLLKEGKENKEPYKVNSVHAIFKDMRLIFNEAARKQKIKQESNPFNLHQFSSEFSDREPLTIDEVHKLENYYPEYWSWEFHAKNMWLLSLYCHGVRFGDLIQLKKSWFENKKTGEIDEWNLSYSPGKGKNAKISHSQKNRKNTQTLKVVTLLPEAIDIIKIYAVTKSEFLFPFLTKDDYRYEDIDAKKHKKVLTDAISSWNATANKYIKSVARKAGIETKIMFHSTRNTLAQLTIEREKDPKAVQSILNHQSEGTGKHYYNDAIIISKERNIHANELMKDLLI